MAHTKLVLVSLLHKCKVEGGLTTSPTRCMSTLLYLDDEEPIGRVISRYFSRRGDRVLLAQSVEEAKSNSTRVSPPPFWWTSSSAPNAGWSS
jgi:hypothetical protein